jgi:signal transduction histidine kinase/CheY-like chemotaxis protein
MGTQKKILLTLFVYVILASLSGIIAYNIYKKQERTIVVYNREQLEQRTHAIIAEQEERVHQIMSDYTYWDDFVNYLKTTDQKWAEANIATLISSFDFESVHIVNLNGKRLFSAFVDSLRIPETVLYKSDLLPELYSKRYISYVINVDDHFLMVQGATIHPTNDPQKLTDPSGYFFAVKEWDVEMLQSMESISGCKVTIGDKDLLAKQDFGANSIQSAHVFKNWHGEESGTVVFSSELTLITLLKDSWRQMGLLLVISVIGFLISLTVLLGRLVSRPLRLVGEIVENEDLTKIPLLKKNSRDFERIGTLIEQFLKQKNDLVKAMQLAKASDQIKTDFLNNISHEVRTPLNGIVGASTLLTDDDIPKETREEMIGILNDSTRRLLRTITQYMDISLLSSDNMPCYPIETDLNTILDPILDEYKTACQQKDIQWIVQFPREHSLIKVLVDKLLLDKIINHLLDNAIKFTERGSVKFGYKIKQSHLEFYVIDSGIGIDKSIQPKIFKNFSQEDTSNLRRYEGSGLGLAISLKSAQLMGGNIWFESEKGKGTSFYFSLPFESNQQVFEKVKQNDANKISQTNKLVLIAEDDDSNYIMLSTLLHKYFIVNTERVYNGKEAVDYCNLNLIPSLILMDIRMPVMDGYTATGLIKQSFPNLPIVAVTAFGMSGDEQRALESGCDGYISKPINTSVLLAKLEPFLEYRT